MSTFSIHTEISIEIYAGYPKGSKNVSSTYQSGELPPFLGKGIVIRKNGIDESWSVTGNFPSNTVSVPNSLTLSSDDRLYTAHLVKVSNKTGIADAEPCLQAAPTVSETLANLQTGITDTSAITFTILKPEFQRFFSPDFLSTESSVLIERVSGSTRSAVWRGFVKSVSFGEVETTISARPNLKKLDAKATFGFDNEVLKWSKTDFKIPIISARMIPYTIRVDEHPTQLAPTYPAWERDWDNHARSIDESFFNKPGYVSFDKKDLVQSRGEIFAEYKNYISVPGESYVLKATRGIFILPSEAEIPRFPIPKDAPPGTKPEDQADLLSPIEDTFRSSLIPIEMQQSVDRFKYFAIPASTISERISYTDFANVGSSFAIWASLGLAEYLETPDTDYIDNKYKLFGYQETGEVDLLDPVRLPHPLDGYRWWNSDGWMFCYLHHVDKIPMISNAYVSYFLTGRQLYTRDYWVTVCSNWYKNGEYWNFGKYDSASSKINRVKNTSGLLLKSLIRCKDLYSTEGGFKDHQEISWATVRRVIELDSYSNIDYLTATAGGKLKMQPEYDGKASNMLRCLPYEFYQDNVEYQRATKQGGAYLVSKINEIPRYSYQDIPQATITGRNPPDLIYLVSGYFPSSPVDMSIQRSVIFVLCADKKIRCINIFGERLAQLDLQLLSTSDWYGVAVSNERIYALERNTAFIRVYNHRRERVPEEDISIVITNNYTNLDYSDGILYTFNSSTSNLDSFVVKTKAKSTTYSAVNHKAIAISTARNTIFSIASSGSVSNTRIKSDSKSYPSTYLFKTAFSGNTGYTGAAFFEDRIYGITNQIISWTWTNMRHGYKSSSERYRPFDKIKTRYVKLEKTSDYQLSYINSGSYRDYGFIIGDDSGTEMLIILDKKGNYHSKIDLDANSIYPGGSAWQSPTSVWVADRNNGYARNFQRSSETSTYWYRVTINEFSIGSGDWQGMDIVEQTDNIADDLGYFARTVGSSVVIDVYKMQTGSKVSTLSKSFSTYSSLSGRTNSTISGVAVGLSKIFTLYKTINKIGDLRVNDVNGGNHDSIQLSLRTGEEWVGLSYHNGQLALFERKTSDDVGSTNARTAGIYVHFYEYRKPVFKSYYRQSFDASFNFYYHHDMYDADNIHLKPSTFCFAAAKNAGLTPSWKQDGSSGLTGNIDNHKMQLIESSDVTYRELFKRVLPSLGYILRLNYGNGKVDLVDIATPSRIKWQFGDNMVKIQSIESNFEEQYSVFTFENPDMLKGENTLEEWKDDPNQQGRYVIFNSNAFVRDRSLTIKTGTWTSEWSKVATILSLRKDRYTLEISNFNLLNSTGTLIGPRVGDRLRLKSQRIPKKDKQVDLLIMAKNQNEQTTMFTGVSIS